MIIFLDTLLVCVMFILCYYTKIYFKKWLAIIVAFNYFLVYFGDVILIHFNIFNTPYYYLCYGMKDFVVAFLCQIFVITFYNSNVNALFSALLIMGVFFVSCVYNMAAGYTYLLGFGTFHNYYFEAMCCVAVAHTALLFTGTKWYAVIKDAFRKFIFGRSRIAYNLMHSTFRRDINKSPQRNRDS